MLSFCLPTRDRAGELARTLEALGRLDARAFAGMGGAEVLIADNAGRQRAQAAARLANGWPVQVLRMRRNAGAAARNDLARAARGEWLVMLDDDSAPVDAGLADALREADAGTLAVAAEVALPSGGREAGGLPEVVIGCGAAVRREAFLDAGGYDASFDYYVEEYDLCARLLLAGGRVEMDRRFRVEHRKVGSGRDMGRILRRLVRNNGWTVQRYAPARDRRRLLRETVGRYGRIAVKERAVGGYALGLAELALTLRAQRRRAMDRALFDRFTGLAHARATLGDEPALRGGARAAVVAAGKNAWAVRAALDEVGACVVGDEREADVLVIGTLSPGPMLDAVDALRGERRPVVAAWRPRGGSGTEGRAGRTMAA